MSDDKPKATRKRRTKAEMEAARAAGGEAPSPGAVPSPQTEGSSVGSDALIDAIKWCNIAQSDDDLRRPIYETHSMVTNGWLLAFDGVISAGHACPLQGQFCPHTARLLAALTKGGKGLAVVMDDGKLRISGKGFRVNVPFVPPETVTVPFPENAAMPAGDALATAIEAVYGLTRASGETVLESSIMLTNYGTAIATNRHVFVEAYHGVQIPREVIIPRRMATAMRGKSDVVGLGFGDNALTVWYSKELTRYIRCQLHELHTWPPLAQCMSLFPEGGNYDEIPKGLAEAVEAVEPHSEDGALFLDGARVQSARTANESEATYDVKGLPEGLVSYTAEHLAYMCKHGKTVNWFDGTRCIFQGDHKGLPVRGTVTTRTIND